MTDLAELKTAIADYQAAATEGLEETRREMKVIAQRVDRLEIRATRPGLGGQDRIAAGSVEAKAWLSYLRRGREGMDDFSEVKSLVIGDDTRGGFLAPSGFVAKLLKNIVRSHRSAKQRRWALPRQAR